MQIVCLLLLLLLLTFSIFSIAIDLHSFAHCCRLDAITKRIKQLEDLITDNSASNLVKHVALLTTTIATSSALTSTQQTSSITNQLAEINLNTSVHSGKIVSIETLLDALVILYEECSNSSLRREKTVSDFLELCKLWPIEIELDESAHVLMCLFVFSPCPLLNSKTCSFIDKAAATHSQRL